MKKMNEIQPSTSQKIAHLENHANQRSLEERMANRPIIPILTDTTVLPKQVDAMVLFDQGLKKLKNRYRSQDRSSWNVFRTAGKVVFNSLEVTEPAVILLAGDQSIATCFAQELAAVALASFGLDDKDANLTVINGASFRNSDHLDAKKALDTQLSIALSRFNVSTLLAIESLPGDLPVMLHSYCDHENAPFKNAFLIFSFGMDTVNVVDRKQCNAAVQAALGQRWMTENGLNEDKIGALFARMTNFIVCLHPQSDITC